MMIISAEGIEGTSVNAGGPHKSSSDKSARLKKKKLPAHRHNVAQFQSVHVYKLSKSLDKLSSNKSKITWKCLLTEILKVDSEVLPQNIVLVAKLNNSCIKERQQYSVVCNENDFLAIKKLAKENKCSFSIIVKYLKNEVFAQKDAQKYIDDLLKPNSVHLAITVQDRSYAANNKNCSCTNGICAKNNQQSAHELGLVKVFRDFVSMFHDNLASLESYLNSISSQEKKTHTVQAGQACDHCLRSIVGTRYRCSVCANFVLCESCEEISEQVHDESHLFFKIKKSSSEIAANLSNANSESDRPSTTSSILGASTFLEGNLNIEQDKSTSTLIDVNDITSHEETSESSKTDNKDKVNDDKNGDKQAKTVYKVEAGSKITKIWKIRNNGTTPWNSHLTLRRISGNIEPIPEKCHSLPVPLLGPGQSDIISITFKVPSDVTGDRETHLFSVWRFCYKGKIFGKPLNLNAIVKANSNQERETEQPNQTDDQLHISVSDHEVTSDDEDSVVYPPCFNLDVPFLQSSGSKECPTSLAFTAATTSDRKSVLETKSKSANSSCLMSTATANRGTFASTSTSSVSATRSSTCKNNLAKKLELLENHKKACYAKKRHLKSAKPGPGSAKHCNDLLIPVPSSSIMEKIKCKNATIKEKLANEGSGQTQCATKTGDHCQETPKKSSTNRGPSTSAEQQQSQPSSPLMNMANFSLVGQTLSTLCNMIANPAPSVSDQPKSHNNNNRKASNDHLRDALQKLYEMGFCNEKLNVELLIKNNLDVQRTVQSLFSSCGNNLFSLAAKASMPTATSASKSTDRSNGGGGPTAVPVPRTGEGSPSPSQQQKPSPKSYFSVDSVD